MPNHRKPLIFPILLAGMALPLCAQSATPVGTPLDSTFARSATQPVDEEYTSLIRKYTTDPKFSSPLVDYLPGSKTVPTPIKTLGVIAGAPDVLPYAEGVAQYFRLLAASSPRVKVVSIGRSEEGREMIAAAIADESL